MDSLIIKDKKYKLPIYLPDATRGVTKGVDSVDLAGAGIEGVVVNTYHLMSSPGIKVLKKFNGVKGFMNFQGLLVSDSGGWQVFSLIHRNKNRGKITDQGVTFSICKNKNEIFTPEKSINVQFSIGSDILICLDDFTPPDATRKQAEATVRRTIVWAEKSKREYQKIITKNKFTNRNRPHLYAVVQGGYYKDLRKKCAEKLIKLGFDGYGYGGYVVDDKGQLDIKLSRYISKLLPQDKPKFALGIGRPLDIVKLSAMGWDIFDCTLPTRDARHKRLYTFRKRPKNYKDLRKASTFGYIYIDKKIFEGDNYPIDKNCNCYTCKNFSKAYLRHLFKINDTLAYKLATIHNLKVYSQTMQYIRDLN